MGTDKEKDKEKEKCPAKIEETAAAGDAGVPTTEITPVDDDRNTVKNVSFIIYL